MRAPGPLILALPRGSEAGWKPTLRASASKGLKPRFHLGLRAAVVASAYLTTAVVVLVVILTLRHSVAPGILQRCLGFVFIATLAAGLEPATAKAAALRVAGLLDAPALLTISVLKGALASPILAVIWRTADPNLAIANLAWLPLVCIAGFTATDLRVLFDLEGRHALAIWLKQGSLAIGVLLLAALVLAGAPLFWAIGVSTMGRLLVSALAAFKALRGAWRPPSRAALIGLVGDRRWIELAGASVISAVSGSTDRVVGLRFLGPGAWAGYYLVFEILTKFWFIPYMLSPIIFARRAAGERQDPLISRAWTLTALAGVAFLAVLAGTMALFPLQVARFVGFPFGWPVLAFAAAVVIASFTQLKIAALQGAGEATRAVLVITFGAVVSAVLFLIFVRRFGAVGLLEAWLVKSVLEFAAVMVWRRAPAQ